MKTITKRFTVWAIIISIVSLAGIAFAEERESAERDARLHVLDIEQAALTEQYHHLLMEIFKLRLARESKEIDIRHSGEKSMEEKAKKMFAMQRQKLQMLDQFAEQTREKLIRLKIELFELEHPHGDADKLDGKWTGRDVESEIAIKMIIEGRKARMDCPAEGVWYEGEFIVESENEEYWEVEFRIKDCAEEQYRGKTSLGLAKLEGDRLVIAANEPGESSRPTNLEPSGETKVFVLERE